MEIHRPTSRGRSTNSSNGPTTIDDVAAHATTATTNANAVTNDATTAARYDDGRNATTIANDGWYARNDARYATANDGRNAGYDANGTTHDGRYANARDDGYVATYDGRHAWNDADDGRYEHDVIFFYYYHDNQQLLFQYDVLINFSKMIKTKSENKNIKQQFIDSI